MEVKHLNPGEYGVTAAGWYVVERDHVIAGPFETEDEAEADFANRLPKIRAGSSAAADRCQSESRIILKCVSCSDVNDTMPARLFHGSQPHRPHEQHRWKAGGDALTLADLATILAIQPATLPAELGRLRLDDATIAKLSRGTLSSDDALKLLQWLSPPAVRETLELREELTLLRRRVERLERERQTELAA
jgi:hypothetical protein